MNLYEMTYDTFFWGGGKEYFISSQDHDLWYDEGMNLLLVNKLLLEKLREPIMLTQVPLVSVVSFWENEVSRFDHLVSNDLSKQYGNIEH